MALVLAPFWHCFGTGPGTVLALFLHRACPSLALHGTPYMHSSILVWCAYLRLTLAPAPWVHLPHPAPATRTTCLPPVPAPEVLEVLWGSLLAAPVARLGRHVTWPTKQGTRTPLIGTPLHAPGVTQHWAITASTANNTLLWSTLSHLVLYSNKTPARACIMAI